jgi:hypothetical protein
MKIAILWNDAKETVHDILDYYVDSSFLILYEHPDKKVYLKIDSLARFTVRGLEIEDEIEDKLETIRENSKD